MRNTGGQQIEQAVFLLSNLQISNCGDIFDVQNKALFFIENQTLQVEVEHQGRFSVWRLHSNESRSFWTKQFGILKYLSQRLDLTAFFVKTLTSRFTVF